MFGFLKKKIVEASNATAIQEIQAFRQFMSVASDEEAGAALVATALAVNHFKTSQFTQRPFPEEYLTGMQLANTPEKQGELSITVLEIMRLHKAAQQSGSPKGEFIASGYAVIIHSVRAVARSPQILVEGRLLWKELMRGLPYFTSSYRDLVNSSLSDDEIASYLFVPAMLAPGFETTYGMPA